MIGNSRHRITQTQPPPTCSNGVIYTVRPGDTLFTIALRFGIGLAELIASNPQISNPNRILPGQEICVVLLIPPRVSAVQLLGINGAPLLLEGGFVQLSCQTVVRIAAAGEPSHALIFFTPAGTETFAFTQLVGVVIAQPSGGLPDFLWRVPSNLLGSVFVAVFNNVAGTESPPINVFSGECPEH